MPLYALLENQDTSNVGGFMNTKFVTNFQSQIGINIWREVYSRFLSTYFWARFFAEDFKHNKNCITSLIADFREENQLIYEEEMSKSHVLTRSF